MRLAVGSDERNHVTDHLVKALGERGHEVSLVGPLADEEATWPDVAVAVADAVAAGEAEEGILCCWTGTGVSMAANRNPAIRAALCGDAETARGARRWNDANVLCLSLRLTTEALVDEILEAWFSPYEVTPEDQRDIAKLAERAPVRVRSS